MGTVTDLVSKRNSKKKSIEEKTIVDFKDDEKVAGIARGLYPWQAGSSTVFCPASCSNMPNPIDTRLIITSQGNVLPAVVSHEGVVRTVGDEEILRIVSYYADFCQNYWPEEARFIIQKWHREAIIDAWKYNSMQESEIFPDAILNESDIFPMRFKSEPGLTWCRHNFDPTPTGGSIWENEVFPRFKNNLNPFLSWCGSLCFPGTQRTISPWVWGEGGSGKSTVVEFVMSVLGSAATTIDDKLLLKDSFIASSLIGKLVCSVPEAGDKTMANPIWKRLTGEEFHTLNRKRKDAITVKLATKFICSSNQFPKIMSGKEYARRVMPIEFQSPEGWEPTREKEQTMELLRKHAGYFWWRAIEEFKKDPMLKNIDRSQIDELQEDENEMFGLWCQKYVRFESGYVPTSLVQICAEMDGHNYASLRKYLLSKNGVKIEPRYLPNGQSARCFIGITDPYRKLTGRASLG